MVWILNSILCQIKHQIIISDKEYIASVFPDVLDDSDIAEDEL